MAMHTGALSGKAAAERPAPLSRQRFAVLDGLRGVAAMMVVVFHSFGDGSLVPNGRVAVDLFFILSGFVIAYSYDDRLGVPNGKKQFLLSRFIRLYPMLFIGALGGIVFAVIHNFTNPSHAYSYHAIAASGVLSLLVLPNLRDASINDFVFNFNPPIWSLFFEIVANLAYVLFFRFLSVRVLACVSILGLVGVVALGELGGDSQSDFASGFPRVMLGFFSGVLLFKLWRSGRLPGFRANAFVASILILVVFAFPVTIGGWLYVPAFALLLAAVVGGINSRPASTDALCEFFGFVSYPIYLLHVSALYVVTFIGSKVAFGKHGPVDPLLIAYLVAMPFIGYVFARYYEAPARSFLQRTFAAKRTLALSAAAQPSKPS